VRDGLLAAEIKTREHVTAWLTIIMHLRGIDTRSACCREVDACLEAEKSAGNEGCCFGIAADSSSLAFAYSIPSRTTLSELLVATACFLMIFHESA